MIKASEYVKTVLIALNEKWGYIYGTAGDSWTETKQKNLEAKYNSDPSKYSSYKLSAQYGTKWIGHKVADCSGLVKWALVQNGSTCPHGSNSIWRSSLSEKGAIEKNTVLAPGELVFKLKNGTDYHHVGVYIGDGAVVEAQGSKTGVVKSKVSSGWTHHGKLKVVDYDGKNDIPADTKEDSFEMGDYVVTAQNGKQVRIRKGPSKSSNVAYEVPVGSDVKVLAEKDGWATVEYTIKGYMMTDFLKKK